MNIAANPITPEELQSFRQDLLREVRRMLKQWQTVPSRQWLKTHDIVYLLGVSPSTVRAMRKRGVLPYSKIGNVIYYDMADVQRMLSGKTVSHMVPYNKLNENQPPL